MLRQLNTLLLLFAMTAVGCTPVTQMQINSAPISLPEQFSNSGTNTLQQQWWQEFGDPNLNVLIEKALTDNFSLLAARERLLQASAVARKVGADLSPTLDLKGSLTETWTRRDGTSDSAGDFLLGLQASYEIDLWGRLRSLKDAAVLDTLASKEDLETAALSIAAQITNTWYSLAASNSKLELLKKQQEVNSLGLELIQLRFNAGQTGIADILQQQQLIESKSGEQHLQQATSAVLQNQLAILCGASPGLFGLDNSPKLIDPPALPETGIPSMLLTRRPDVKSSYAELLAADRRVAAAISDQYPALSISANLNTSGSSSSDLFSNWLASLGANLVGPLLDGGKRQAEVDRTSAVAREKLNNYKQIIITSIGEVEDALIREQQQAQYIDSLNVQLGLANRTLINVRDRYKQGVEDYQRVLTALLSQQSLQINLLTARQQLVGYRIDLYRALGASTIFPTETTLPANNRS